MKIQYPDYNNCIANLACSILKHFGVQPPNATLALADEYLEKNYENVVVLLLDGMGENIVNMHLAKDGFLRSNLKAVYTSVFPPTTVAATTAMNSGLFPNQSAWLGWTGYFKDIDRNIEYFTNCDGDTGGEIININIANTFVPYKSIKDSLAENGKVAYELSVHKMPAIKDFNSLCNEIKRHCAIPGKKYIYAYWNEPDFTMHNSGVDKAEIKSLLLGLEDRTRRLVDELEDTLFIVTADHGMINIENEIITEYPDVMECLERMPSIEARAINMYIKAGMEKQFEYAFQKHFGDYFMLLKKEQVIEKGLFGNGNTHEKFNEMIGDYLGVAISNKAIINNWYVSFKGHHAGITEEEMRIPLIIFEK